jgi:hypothetical protein
VADAGAGAAVPRGGAAEEVEIDTDVFRRFFKEAMDAFKIRSLFRWFPTGARGLEGVASETGGTCKTMFAFVCPAGLGVSEARAAQAGAGTLVPAVTGVR